jgi:hypothetical protein
MGKRSDSKTQNLATPWPFVRAVESVFGLQFTYDMAAEESTAKAPVWFGPEWDSLSHDWPTDGCWCWLNPTFWNLGRWVAKCSEQAMRGARIVSIWPLSGDVNMVEAWQGADVYVIHGRIWPNVRGLMLCVWGRKTSPRRVVGLAWGNGRLTEKWRRMYPCAG